MRMGRLAISRGFPLSEESGEPVRLAIVASSEPPSPPVASDALTDVHARLEALERLTRLCEAGALTIDEFLVEKAAILGHPRSNLMMDREEGAPPISFVPGVPRGPASGRSLLGRLGWAILPLGLIAGIGLTAISQPDVAAQIWQEGLRLFGL